MDKSSAMELPRRPGQDPDFMDFVSRQTSNLGHPIHDFIWCTLRKMQLMNKSSAMELPRCLVQDSDFMDFYLKCRNPILGAKFMISYGIRIEKSRFWKDLWPWSSQDGSAKI